MQIFFSVLTVLVLLVILISVLHRYYRKTGREFALVRTGFGGRQVVLDGATLVLPFLHQVEAIPLRVNRLVLSQVGGDALVTADSLRVNVEVEFAVRVAADEESVATAASTLGAPSMHAEDLYELLHGRLSDAIQQVVARSSLAELHSARHEFSTAVSSILEQPLSRHGLVLDAVSLLQLDQAPLAAFNQDNVFDAAGLRQLSETLSQQRLQRATIDAQTEVSIRETELASLSRRLELEKQQADIELKQREHVETTRAQSEADIETSRQRSQGKSEEARLYREREVRQMEIARDLALREEAARALERAESADIAAQVALAHKRAEESQARAESELKRSSMVQAQEQIQREKETLAAQRNADVAMIRQRHLGELQAAESSVTEELKLATANAEANIARLQAESEQLRAEVNAKSIASRAQAENLTSEPVLRHKIELEKIRVLPEVTRRMAKPLEKIDSIRINHLGGMDGGNAARGGNSPLGDSLQQVMGLAVQMPALKKLGEEIGLDFDSQLGARMADAAGRVHGAVTKSNKTPPSTASEQDDNNRDNPQENG